MKTKLIAKSFDSKEFLDGFDGENYEWTLDRKSAWSFDDTEAETRLAYVRMKEPLACIVNRFKR